MILHLTFGPWFDISIQGDAERLSYAFVLDIENGKVTVHPQLYKVLAENREELPDLDNPECTNIDVTEDIIDPEDPNI